MAPEHELIRTARGGSPDAVRDHLNKVGITETDIVDAVSWARSIDQSVHSNKAAVEVFVKETHIDLEQVANDVASALVHLDCSGEPFKQFRPGVGPYGEPQLVKAVADYLNQLPGYRNGVKTKRTPDLLISGEWALEFKITRPFGDNGKEAENWSVNLLHPYEGNVSVLGDCLKLRHLKGPELKGVIVVGYEHTPPKIPLTPLIEAFECVAARVLDIKLGTRIEIVRSGLCHPVHQQLRLVAWEVLP